MSNSSPSNADLEARARAIVAKVFGIEPVRVDANASPDTIAKWDSHGHMSLVLALEQEFAVQFSDTQIYEMLNFELVVITLKELGAR